MKKGELKFKIIFLAALLFCGFFGVVEKSEAATYYVDYTLVSDCLGDYSVAGRTCAGSDGYAYNDLYDINQIVSAGDTVYMRGGSSEYEIYDVTARSGAGEGIQPDNSGTSYSNMITYATYNDEMVHLQGSSCPGSGWIGEIGIHINQKDYIKVTGSAANKLKISCCASNIRITGSVSGSKYARYNEIAYIWSTSTALNSSYVGHVYNQQVAVYENAQYNWIHNCHFEKHGYNTGALDLCVIGYSMGPGWNYGETSADYFNVVENCEFNHGDHSVLQPSGKYNIYRNNYLHNEAWTGVGANKSYGFRNAIAHEYYPNAGHNLLEGNRFGHAWSSSAEVNFGSHGLALATSNNLLRYNAFFNNGSSGIEFRASDYANNYYVRSNENYLYNNTFYANGWNALDAEHYEVVKFGYSNNIDYETSTNIYWQAAQNNVAKNNLFYNNYSNQHNDPVFGTGYWDHMINAQACPSSQTQGCNVISSNYNDDAGENTNPLFRDEVLNDYNSWTLPDLNLQSTSPAIDNGTFLTQADGAGTSKATLVVDDASYFQDGKFGVHSGCNFSMWAPGINMQADWIAIGTINNVVRINSINYSSNTITLDSLMTWSDDAPIWLYKKSDGAVVLSGSAPDQGSHEYFSGDDAAPPSAPTGLGVL